MKTSITTSRRAAFTLLELLIVISIIAILTGLAFTGYQQVMAKARDLQAKSAIRQIVTAISNYRVDNGRMPVLGSLRDDVTVELTSSNPLLQVLLGQNVNELNRKQIAYIESPMMAAGGANGLVGKDEHFSLVDPWTQPYRVTMDSNTDGKIANPDAQNEDPKISQDASHFLPASVIVESAGRDKRFGTRYNLVSWR